MKSGALGAPQFLGRAGGGGGGGWGAKIRSVWQRKEKYPNSKNPDN